MSHTLLLADDSTTMQRVVELTFAEQGLTVVSVADGQQAVDYITRRHPSLALVSVSLPRINGFDVARFVRDRAESRVPVVLLAGAFDNLDEAQVRESGAAGVLVKPFEPAVVIRRVKELLGMKSEASTPVEESHASPPSRIVTAPVPPVEASPGDAAHRDEPAADYRSQLNAAFQSLDAQPTSRPADPAARPSFEQPAADPQSSRDGTLEPAAGDAAFVTSGVEPADWRQPPSAPVASPIPPVDASAAPQANEQRSPSPFDIAMAVAPPPSRPAHDLGLSSAPVAAPRASPSAGVAAADAFAMLWAQEQGEPLPPLPPAAPIELSEQTAEALVSQLTTRVSARLGSDLGDRLTNDLHHRLSTGVADSVTAGFGSASASVSALLASRLEAGLAPAIVDGLATRITTGVAEQVAHRVAERVLNELHTGVVNELADRMASQLADRLIADLADRLTAGLAERVAGIVTERMLQGVFGESLRATVNEVAERVVRAEIERIRTAAEALRSR
jgi:CheY-like chemotaxis protein